MVMVRQQPRFKDNDYFFDLFATRPQETTGCKNVIVVGTSWLARIHLEIVDVQSTRVSATMANQC